MSRILEIWLSGGWVMLPLFALAVLLYTQAFHLVLYVRRTDLNEKRELDWFGWVRSPETAEGRVGEIIRYTQSDVSSAKQVRNRFDEVRLALVSAVERRTKFVGTLVAAAPLLGLLGTVLGMLQTFFGISTSGGAETAGVVAAGISEALVTTQTGLTIALPGLFIVMVIQRQRHGLEAKIARLESLTLNHLKFD
ncbi:MAG: MotA/TolQ/ExbB proton channel family protein [Proteobacteria bacterium]|nr:MotA/TolQ/ExbB proton channel family protein [Pseudomonadota bacterium]